MTGGVESIGDAVTGGLVARAAEPSAGEPGTGLATGACLNCHAPLSGPYCALCGQKAQVHRSLRAFFGDFAAGMLNFEGKFWRTLPLLGWRPGELTRRYIAGERARFISPIALYLFTVFVMFAVLNLTGTLDGGQSIKTNVNGALVDEQTMLTRLEAERARAVAAHRNTAAIDRRIASQKEDIARIRGVQAGKPITPEDFGDGTPAWVPRLVEKVQADPSQAVGQIQDAASKFSWMLIPLSLPFMWLLFPFSGRYRMYDHGVFVTYSLSFMMMLVIVSGLLVAVGWTALAGFLFFVPPIHMYRQLKGAYALGWFGALWRTILLVGFSFAAAGMFAALMVAIGVL